MRGPSHGAVCGSGTCVLWLWGSGSQSQRERRGNVGARAVPLCLACRHGSVLRLGFCICKMGLKTLRSVLWAWLGEVSGSRPASPTGAHRPSGERARHPVSRPRAFRQLLPCLPPLWASLPSSPLPRGPLCGAARAQAQLLRVPAVTHVPWTPPFPSRHGPGLCEPDTAGGTERARPPPLGSRRGRGGWGVFHPAPPSKKEKGTLIKGDRPVWWRGLSPYLSACAL